MRNDSVTKLSHFSESFRIIGPFSFLRYLLSNFQLLLVYTIWIVTKKELSDSSLNPLKKDGLSVRNIGKPQIAFLFAFLLFISIDRRGVGRWCDPTSFWIVCDPDHQNCMMLGRYFCWLFFGLLSNIDSPSSYNSLQKKECIPCNKDKRYWN